MLNTIKWFTGIGGSLAVCLLIGVMAYGLRGEPAPAPSEIVGTWTGAYTPGASGAPQLHQTPQIHFAADGTCRAQGLVRRVGPGDRQVVWGGKGTWYIGTDWNGQTAVGIEVVLPDGTQYIKHFQVIRDRAGIALMMDWTDPDLGYEILFRRIP